jgi:hypothetical protein
MEQAARDQFDIKCGLYALGVYAGSQCYAARRSQQYDDQSEFQSSCKWITHGNTSNF